MRVGLTNQTPPLFEIATESKEEREERLIEPEKPMIEKRERNTETVGDFEFARSV